MERFIDHMLDRIFAGLNLPLINIIVGLLLIVVGVIVICFSSKPLSKGKKTAGWICIAIGCFGILSGITHLLFL